MVARTDRLPPDAASNPNPQPSPFLPLPELGFETKLVPKFVPVPVRCSEFPKAILWGDKSAHRAEKSATEVLLQPAPVNWEEGD
jgi:hypothetical protein